MDDITDTIRINWLIHNASKLGFKPEWSYTYIDKDEKNSYGSFDEHEFTDFRKMIDEFIKQDKDGE
jgi:hypothetical protein